MDPLLAQEEEYKARAERQKALRSLQEQNAINARNRRDLAASLAPMGEKERRLLEGAKARKEAKDWAGACAMYEQFLRYAPDNHDAQLEVRLLTQLINHQQAQQKHEARQRRFEEKLSEPPAMGSLPVGLGSPIIDDIPHVQRGSGGMPLSQTMYRRQLAEQAQEMKQRKDKERAEEAAMDARINQVARIEEALARQQHEAAQLKGNVVDKNARAAEIEARRQAKMDAWRKEQEEVLRPLQPSALGGLLAGVGERDVLQAERMELVAKMAELRTAAAASASGRGGGGKGAAEGVYVDKDGNARMAFQVASPAAAAALGGSPVRPPSAGGGHISRSRPQSGSPAGPSPSAAGAAAAARASPAAAAAAPSPLGRPTYPYGRPVVDQAVAKISPAAVRARQEQFVKKHAPLQQSRRLPPPPAHMVAAPPVQPSWQPYQTVAPRRPVS